MSAIYLIQVYSFNSASCLLLLFRADLSDAPGGAFQSFDDIGSQLPIEIEKLLVNRDSGLELNPSYFGLERYQPGLITWSRR